MNGMKIWTIWMFDPNADKDDNKLSLYDLCLTKEAGEKSLQEAKEYYSDCDLFMEVNTAHV